MADPLLERLSKEDGVTVTPVTPMPAQIPSPKNEAEVNQFKSIISSPGFYKSPPDQQRAKIRQIPSFSQVPDADLDKFIGTDVRSIVDNKPGLLRTFWEDLNSPVKAFTGKSLKERFDGTAQDYATGATGKLMQEAAAADRAIKNAGFGGDEAVTPILQANATPEGRRFTHALTSEAIGLAESPLTYVGLGESAVTGPGAARLVAKIGDAGNIAKEAFAATPVIAKAVGKAGEVAAKGLKGVQTAQLLGAKAFQAQALAGAATSVNNYVKDPTPENAASAIFGLGLGGMVASHLARNTKANYDAGGEAVRIMERARDLAWNEGAMRLDTLPVSAQAEFIRQAGADVFAGKPGTEARTIPGKLKAAKDKAWRLKQEAKKAEAGDKLAEEEAPPPGFRGNNPATTPEWAARNYQSAPGQEVILAERSGAIEPQYSVTPQEPGIQPASNFEANPNPNGFTRPGEGVPPTRRPPMLSGNVQSDVYNQPQGDYQDPRALAAGQPGGQVPMLRERGNALEPQYTVNPLVTDLQPAANFEANPEQFTRPINEYPPIRNYGQRQIQGTATPPAFVMPGRGAQGPIQPIQSGATPVATTPTPVVTPQGATPRPQDSAVSKIAASITSPRHAEEIAQESMGGNAGVGKVGASTWVNKYTGEVVAIGNIQHVDRAITDNPDVVQVKFRHRMVGNFGSGGIFVEEIGEHTGLTKQAEANINAAIQQVKNVNLAEIPRGNVANNNTPRQGGTPRPPSISQVVVPPAVQPPVKAVTPAPEEDQQQQSMFGEQPAAQAGAPAVQWKPGDPRPSRGQVVQVDPQLLVPDPITFQYKGKAIGKGGTDDRFREVTEYNYGLGGNIIVWQDPKTGILHPTDGHHRTEIAQRTKAPFVNVIFSEEPTAADARVEAALLNIGNDKGEPIDAAKIFRDSNIPVEQINKLIAKSSKLWKQGTAIAKLSPKLFRMVIDEDMAPERGAMIGEKLAGDDALQDQVFDYIEKREGKGRKDYTEREIGSMIDRFKASNEVLGNDADGPEQGGFGWGAAVEKNYIDELVSVEEALRRMLKKDQSLFRALSNAENIELAEAKGNVIKGDENLQVADQAKTVIGLFEKLIGKSGPIEDILQVAAKEVAAGKSAKSAAAKVYGEIKSAVERLIDGKPADISPARQSGASAGGNSVGVGDDPGELGDAAAKSIQSASSQPAASKKVAAKPKSEVAPAEGEPLGLSVEAMVEAFQKMQAAKRAIPPKDEPLLQREGGSKKPLAAVAFTLPEEDRQDWLDFVDFYEAELDKKLSKRDPSTITPGDRASLGSMFPDLAEKYFGAVDEKAPAKEVVKAAENKPAAVDAVSSSGIGTEVESASGKVEPDNGRVAEYDGLRSDNNGNVGRDGSAGDRPNGKNAAPVDFENKRIVSAGERMIPPSDTSVIPPEIAKYLKPQQLTGAADAISAMNGPETGFLIADGTGAGKSLMSLTVAKHFADKGFSVLIVSKAEAFKFDYETRQPTGTYARWSKTFGVPLEGYVGPERDNFVTKLEPGKVYAATYDTVFGLAPRENPKKLGVFSKGSPGIAHLVGPNTVLIMDEAHAAKNSGGGAENRANASVDMANRAGKVLMMTATPGDKPAHVQYLQRVGLLEGKSQDQQLSELGFKKKVTKGKDGKEVVTWNIDPQVGKRTVRTRLDALFSRLMANGQMVKREISMDGVDLQMTPISLPEEGYEIMDMIENRLSDGAGLKNVDGLQKAVILGHMRRAQEGYKIPHIVNMAKEELAEGRKVIIVIELVNDSPVIKRTKVMTPHGIETQEEVIHVNKSTAQALKQALFDIGLTPADIAEIHGGAKESSIEAVERFQNGSARVAIITGPSGGTGIDLDDQKGNAPRTMIIATPPFEGTANTQLIGREWRLGTKSLPRVRYVFANTATDHWNMGILADKMKTLGVIVKGEAKGAMDFANIQGGEIRPGFVPEGEFIEDDDAADAPAGAAPKALKGKGGKELPPPVEGGWLQLQPANTYENRLKLGKKGLGGEFDRNFTNRWQIPDTQANRDALAQIKGIRIDGPSNYQPKEKPKVEETPEIRAINEKIRADRAAEMDRLAAESRERVGFAPPAPKPEFGLKPQAGPDLADAGLISPPKVTPKATPQAPRDPAIAALLSGRSGQLPNLGEAPKPPAKLAFGGAKNTQERQLATPRPPMFSDPEDEPLRARERKLSTKRPPASFIEKAVNDQGKATMGADIRALAEDLGSSLYKGQDTAVVAKELLQNAMDATRLLGAGVAGEVSVEIDRVNRIIRVTDNGTGMSKGDLGTVFVDLGASGKRDQDGASGGFGLAKAAPLMMGKSITVRSIHRSPSGELIESGMTTNKEELLGSGATIWSKPAPQGSSTGTSVEVTMPHSDWNPWFQAEQFATRSLKSIRPPAALKVTVGDGRVAKTKADDSVARETMKPATQLSVTGATADIYFSPEKKGLDLSSAYSVSIEINNNGIFQFETSIYLGQSASLKGMPAVIAVDVKATVKEGHKDYPFTANREALRSDDLTDQIKKYVQDTIINPAIKDATDFIQHKYDSLQEISRGVVLFDSGARLTSGEIEWLQDDPDFSNLASVLNKVTANALYAISQSAEIAGRRNLLGLGSGIERAGIVLSKELHGVHITNPKTGKATIFSNPLSFTEGTSPIKAASLIWHTIKHEILHDKVKGHSEEFTVGLTKVDEALGDSFMDSLSELRDAYADKNDKSKFRSGIIEALRIYAESRGRPERERDPFRGEASRIGKPAPGGIRGTPANVSGGGKAAIREVGGAQSGGSRSDGKRTARPPVGDPEDKPLLAREQNSDTLGGLIPEGRAKFMHKNVAEVQRGKPESAMIKAQFANGGGVLNPVVEHVGDLTHRMSEEVTSETGGYGYVKDKVEKTLRWLTKPYGFRREFVENIESNARYAGEDPADRLAKVTAALEKYADEHRKIPVFNDVQRWARDAAVLVGEKRFAKAVEELQKLKAETDKGPEAWAAKAKEVDRTAVEEFLKRRGGGVDPEDTPAYARDPDIKWEPGKPLAELKADTPASRRSRGEVATYLNKQVRKSLGGLSASAGEKAKIARLMNLGRIEIADQIAQKNNGAGFYSKDTPLADADMIRAFPELAEPRKLAFQKALSAVLANNQDPDAEAYVGAQVYDQFRKTGVIPATRPNGTPWPGRGSLEQMQKLERMRKAMGVDGLVAFLTAPQRLSEIPKWRPSVYVSKAKADTYVPGFLVLGDKIGPYWGELMQLRGQESTPIDRWDAAGQYRRMGRLIEGGKPKDAPDNEDDRQIFMRSHGELAKEFGLDRPGTAQSLLWHYEKALYSALGSPSKAGKRSDGTARYLGERGIANERGTELPADDRSANNDRADRVGEAEGRQGKGNDGGVGEARGKTSAQVPAKRTARPPVGDPEDTPLLARAPGPVWYSQLQKAIESKAMPFKAPADQIRAILRNPNSGVKADEVKWSGLDDWLSQQKGSITKEQVLDYLKQNNVVVKEVSYDGAPSPEVRELNEQIDELTAQYNAMDNSPEREAIWDRRYELSDQRRNLTNYDLPAKFSQYKTPGGKDYGELLMTAPERITPLKWEAAPEVGDDTIKSSDGRYEIYDLSARGKGFKVYDKASSVSVIPRGVADSGYATLAEAKAGAARHSAKDTGPEKNFQSSHWEPKNVIAHLRYETRTGPDKTGSGKQKHFLMVENQSDWGQAGARQGFVTEADTKAAAERGAELSKQRRDVLQEIADLNDRKLKKYGDFKPHPVRIQRMGNAENLLRRKLTPEVLEVLGHHSEFNAIQEASRPFAYREAWDRVPAEVKAAAEAYRDLKKNHAEALEAEKLADIRTPEGDALRDKLNAIDGEIRKLAENSGKGVPDMPFSKTWQELVMRRALRHAVENGFDRLSWEPGAVHADRYSLSQVASRITWKNFQNPHLPTNGELVAYDHSGNQISSQRIPESDIADHIGQGAAKALLAAPNKDGMHELAGDDLRVGEQWPTDFYDKKLVGYGNRLAGKFGSKVEKSEIDLPGTEKHEYVGPQLTLDQVHAIYDQKWYAPELQAAAEAVSNEMERSESSFQEAMDAIANSYFGKQFAKHVGGKIKVTKSAPTATVWSIPITEEMRDSVMQGQPLFQKTKRPPSMGLFEAADETELAKKDKERLLGQRLTAQFNSEISMQENLSKLKKKPFVQQQHSFFEALPDDDQTSLFLRGMNTPVKIGLDGKPDTASAIRHAKIRVYAKGGNRAARVYLNPAAHQIIMKAEIEAGVAKPGNPWLGAAMKPVWMYRIVDEMRSTGKLGSKVNDADLMRKMEELADQLEDAVRDSQNPMSVSLIAADGARQDVEAVVRHEQQHADQYAVEPKSNFKPAELFGQQNLLKIETNKTYQKAGEGLMSAGYPYKSIPTEVMSHVVDGRLDDAGKVMTLGVTPEEGLNLYVDLLEAAVATKGRIAYTLVQNAARPTKQTIRQVRRSRDSRSVQRPNQGGAERGADQQSPRAGRPDGGNSGRSQDIPRTKRPPG